MACCDHSKSGFQVIKHNDGDKDEKSTVPIGDIVSVHYKGMLLDGTVFD